MIWLALLGCGRCDEIPGLLPADVLYVGDSVLAWNDTTCRSIAAYTATERGVAYENAAVSGARVLGGGAAIPEQSIAGDWELVVMNGGANDLNSLCGCDACDTVLDRLVSEDGRTGALPELADAWIASGAEVTMLGYYPVAESAWYGFDACVEIIDELDRRVSLSAAQRPGAEFFDLGDRIGVDSKGVYAFDHAHPSPKGAALLGKALAQELSQGVR